MSRARAVPLYQGTSSGGESGTPVNSALITGTSYSVTDLNSGTTYYLDVTAIYQEFAEGGGIPSAASAEAGGYRRPSRIPHASPAGRARAACGLAADGREQL